VTAPIANPCISVAFDCPPLGGRLPLILSWWAQLPALTDTAYGLPLPFDADDLPKNTWERLLRVQRFSFPTSFDSCLLIQFFMRLFHLIICTFLLRGVLSVMGPRRPHHCEWWLWCFCCVGLRPRFWCVLCGFFCLLLCAFGSAWVDTHFWPPPRVGFLWVLMISLLQRLFLTQRTEPWAESATLEEK
jgi:hypothetical protein